MGKCHASGFQKAMKLFPTFKIVTSRCHKFYDRSINNEIRETCLLVKRKSHNANNSSKVYI